MAALAAIRNPQDPKETLVFFATDQYQVGYDIRTEKSLDALAAGDQEGASRGAPIDDEGEAVPTFGSGRGAGSPVSGLVKHPGAFAALAFQNLIKVYGITKSNVICEISPGVRNLRRTVTTTRAALAGCGNGTDAGWLYYLTAAEIPEVQQYQLATDGRITLGDRLTPHPESTLAAWYKELDTSRGVVYQNKTTNDLRYCEIKADGQPNDSAVSNSGGAIPKTPLAAVCKNDVVYLYFINNDKALVRVERSGSGSWTNQIVDKNNDWNSNPLTANLSLNGKYIVVRQQYTEESGIFQWADTRNIAQ